MRALSLPRLALASVVANVGIVITGGAVRLTGSGLGCPTVPRCTDSSYTPTPAMGVHGLIEFGNRMLTFAVGLIAALCLVAALRQRPRRRRVVTLAALVLGVIPAQALLGMVTVWTHLNPWVVGCHFLVSMAVIAAAYSLWVAVREGDAAVVPGPFRPLAGVLLASAGATLVLGTVVTGAGPHAGDEHARRNGLDLATVAQLHADSVFLLVGLTVATWLATRIAGARAAAAAAGWLLAIELAQGAIGFIQYATNLPALAVGLHMAGACAVWVGALATWYATRPPRPADGPYPNESAAAPAGPAAVEFAGH